MKKGNNSKVSLDTKIGALVLAGTHLGTIVAGATKGTFDAQGNSLEMPLFSYAVLGNAVGTATGVGLVSHQNKLYNATQSGLYTSIIAPCEFGIGYCLGYATQKIFF